MKPCVLRFCRQMPGFGWQDFGAHVLRYEKINSESEAVFGSTSSEGGAAEKLMEETGK